MPVNERFRTFAELRTLVEHGIPESRTLDYKVELGWRPGSPNLKSVRDAKREFLADVTSFANAEGGRLLIGIREEKGLAVEIPGIEVADVDQLILDLDTLCANSIEPAIAGLNISAVDVPGEQLELADGRRVVVVVAVPRGINRPHRVGYRMKERFYIRGSAGKRPMDLGEIRMAFVSSEATSERIREFRRRRVASLRAGSIPIVLSEPALMLHLVPLSAFDVGYSVDIKALLRGDVRPLVGGGGWNASYNLDGFFGYNPTSYLLVFRNAIVETVAVGIATDSGLDLSEIECLVARRLPGVFATLERMGVQGPAAVMLTLSGVGGARIYDGRCDSERGVIKRDCLEIPEVLLDDYAELADGDTDDPPAKVVRRTARSLRPIFDILWQAGGYRESPNFDTEGSWRSR
jgi:hypothetical protein